MRTRAAATGGASSRASPCPRSTCPYSSSLGTATPSWPSGWKAQTGPYSGRCSAPTSRPTTSRAVLRALRGRACPDARPTPSRPKSPPEWDRLSPSSPRRRPRRRVRAAWAAFLAALLRWPPSPRRPRRALLGPHPRAPPTAPPTKRMRSNPSYPCHLSLRCSPQAAVRCPEGPLPASASRRARKRLLRVRRHPLRCTGQ